MPRRVLRAEAAVLALAGASALAGTVADAGATGVGLVDAVLRAALGATAVLVAARGGSRSRRRLVARRWMFVIAAALALAGAGLSSAWMAGAALGLSLGTAWARLNAPVLRALSAGFTVQAALRLDRPTFTLGSALLAMVIVALAFTAGVVSLRRRPRRLSVQIGLAAAGAAALVSALGLWSVYAARPDVAKGVGDVTSAVAKARAGDVVGAAERFDEGASSLAAASRRLGSWWARPAMAVPVLGRHSRALRAMAESGSTLSAAGGRVLREADPARIQLSNGAVPLERITALRGQTRASLLALAAAEERLGDVTSPWLVSPVADRLDMLSDGVAAARRDAEAALVASEVAPALLGADRPRRYFLALQALSEARGTGGIIGNFGEITADRGHLKLERLGRTTELNAGVDPARRRLVAPPDFLARYSRFDLEQSWQNINMSPDFPSVAQAITSLYPQSGGRPVDGVIAVDPLGLAAILGVVGPVQVPSWPVPITADNAAQVLLFEQYVRLSGDARVDFLSQVTNAVWQRLIASQPHLMALVTALSPAVAEKHIQFVSTGPGEEEALRRLGVAGSMSPVEGDFLGVVTQNASGNKIDWFLRRSVDYRVRYDPGSGQVRSTARISLTNLAPSSGLPDYVIGSATQPPLPRGANKLYLSVYTPLLLSGARVDGVVTALEAERERDRHVYSTYVVLPPGGSSTIELDLEGLMEGEGDRYGLDLHRQPFPAPDVYMASATVVGSRRDDRPAVGEQGEVQRVDLVADRRLWLLTEVP